MKLGFDIPVIWSNSKLLRILQDFKKYSLSQLQIYGCISKIFPTGRPNDFTVTDIEQAKNIFESAQNSGVETNYLLNGNLSNYDIQYFRKYLETVVIVLNPDLITISDTNLLKHLVKIYNSQNIEVSAIAGIKSISDLEHWLTNKEYIRNIKAVALHQDICRESPETLFPLLNYLEAHSIKPRVLVTESCYYGCPFRAAHYAHFANAISLQPQETFIDPYQINCVIRRLKHPETLLDISGFLMPEKIEEFSLATGIDTFKISGRSMPDEWILNTSKLYFARKSPDNIYEIIVFTVPFLDEFNLKINELFYVNPRAYSDVYSELMNIDNYSKRDTYLKNKAAELFKEGKLAINDPGSIYTVRGDKVLLQRAGQYLKRLENIRNTAPYSEKSFEERICDKYAMFNV